MSTYCKLYPVCVLSKIRSLLLNSSWVFWKSDGECGAGSSVQSPTAAHIIINANPQLLLICNVKELIITIFTENILALDTTSCQLNLSFNGYSMILMDRLKVKKNKLNEIDTIDPEFIMQSLLRMMSFNAIFILNCIANTRLQVKY